jgi:hypothetical protein
MSFLAPKPPKVPPAAKPPTPASNPIFAKDNVDTSFVAGPSSLISTSSSGLKRKASTQRTSLIGG